MVTRSLSLPLLAVIVATVVRTGAAQQAAASEQQVVARGIGPDRARLGFVNAIAGSGKVDLLADGHTLKRNIRYARPLAAKSLHAEGYSIDVDAAKIGLPYIDAFTADLQGGRDYTLVAYGNTDSSSPTAALLVDLPGLLIPKTDVHVLFTNAVQDSVSAELSIDDQVVFSNVVSGNYQGPQTINEGKHRVEVKVNGITVFGPSVQKLKGGETLNLVLIGTAVEGDGNPLQLLKSEMKTR